MRPIRPARFDPKKRCQAARDSATVAGIIRRMNTMLCPSCVPGVKPSISSSALDRRVPVILALLIGLLSTPTAHAATALYYWTGGSATSGNWSVGANWLGGLAPVGGDQRLIFQDGASRKQNTNNLPAGTSFESIWVVDDGYNIHGNTVRIRSLHGRCPGGTSTTFRPDIIAAADLQVFNETTGATFNVLGDVSLGANELDFPNFSNPGDVVMGGVISGTGQVWKTNPGNVSFAGAGANTYSGATTVSAGVLRLGPLHPRAESQLHWRYRHSGRSHHRRI